MPNRYVREGAIESEAVNRLSWQGEVFYRRLINRVDDFGLLEAHPELLRAKLFPLQLTKVSGADVGKLLLECEDAGLVSTYDGPDGKRYLAMDKWEQGRAKTSKYPLPPAGKRKTRPTRANNGQHMLSDVPDSDSDSDTDSDTDKSAAALVLPEVLDTSQFREAWADYESHRRERRDRKLKPRSIKAKWAEMAEWGHDAAIESIRQAISNGWAGTFPPGQRGKKHENNSNGAQSRKTAVSNPDDYEGAKTGALQF